MNEPKQDQPVQAQAAEAIIKTENCWILFTDRETEKQTARRRTLLQMRLMMKPFVQN